MAEIKLQKRYKYAGDIMPKLLDIGFDLETASDFLNSIPDADVAPRAEVAREIFEEIEGSIAVHAFTSKSEDYADGMYDAIEWVDSKIAELKNKYAEGRNDSPIITEV